MEIPKEIQQAFDSVSSYKGHIEFIGEYENKKAFVYSFDDENLSTGFPQICFLDKDGTISSICGLKSFDIIEKITSNR